MPHTPAVALSLRISKSLLCRAGGHAQGEQRSQQGHCHHCHLIWQHNVTFASQLCLAECFVIFFLHGEYVGEKMVYTSVAGLLSQTLCKEDIARGVLVSPPT